MTLRRILPSLALVALAVAAALSACDSGPGFYVYVARIYDPARDCLSDVEAIDVEDGADPGLNCAAQCIVASDGDGGTVVYATTMCGPTPYGVDATGKDPRCAGALAAVGRSDICLDAGSTNPKEAGVETGLDGEVDADAGTAVDASADADADADANTGADADGGTPVDSGPETGPEAGND